MMKETRQVPSMIDCNAAVTSGLVDDDESREYVFKISAIRMLGW